MTLRSTRRGSAMLVTVVLLAVMLVIAAGVLGYTMRDRNRAIQGSRAETRVSCTQAGLQIARGYFGRNFTNWNTYLNAPAQYDPVGGGADPKAAGLQAARPELFTDLDRDGAPDVYIYARDNPDELPPAPINPRRDNDQLLVVGAVCISSTMVPRRDDGTIDPNAFSAEALLAFDGASAGYKSQASGGAAGTGNFNSN